MVLAGCDPSFQRAGIAIWKEDSIIITEVKTDVNPEKSFPQVFEDAQDQSERIVEVMRKYGVSVLMSECPPPQGSFAPGLYGLDVLYLDKLKDVETYILYPNYLQHVHGKRKYNKSESVELARKLLDSLGSDVKVNLLTKRFSNDQAEAVIFLCRLFVLKGMYINKLSICKGLFSNKEKQLRRK